MDAVSDICLANGIIEPFLEIISQIFFVGKFANKKANLPSVLLFSTAFTLVVFIPAAVNVRKLILLILMTIFGCTALKTSRCLSLLYPLVTSGIMSVCFGVINSVSAAFIKILGGINSTYEGCAAMILGEILSLILYCLLCEILCLNLQKSVNADLNFPQTMIAVIPLTLILLPCEHIRSNFYGAADTSVSIAFHAETTVFMFFILSGIICVLFLFAQACGQTELLKKLEFCERKNALREQYLDKSKALYLETKGFRHDVKNHISVLCGLMEKRDYAAAKSYLNELNSHAKKLSFMFFTGSETLDILLENKLSGLPDNIMVKCAAAIPKNSGISEYDICTVFANALDNAVKACSETDCPKDKFIEITSFIQGNFYLVKIDNSFDGKPFKCGTGLDNIRRAAKKYGGTITINSENNIFSLKIIFNISHQ